MFKGAQWIDSKVMPKEWDTDILGLRFPEFQVNVEEARLRLYYLIPKHDCHDHLAEILPNFLQAIWKQGYKYID